MRIKTAIIGSSPDNGVLTRLEEASGRDLSPVYFARDWSEAEPALEQAQYVVVSAASLSALPAGSIRERLCAGQAALILLGECQAPLPSWTEGLILHLRLPADEASPPRGDGLRLNARSGELTADGTRVQLGPRESRLMCVFLARPGEVLTYTELQQAVWGMRRGSGNLVQVTVLRLRGRLRQLGDGHATIENVRGFGYRLRLGP